MVVKQHDHFDTIYLSNAIGQLVTQLSNLSHALEVPAEDIWSAILDRDQGRGLFPNPIISNVARGTIHGLLGVHLVKPNSITAYAAAWDEISHHPNYDSWKEPSA